MYGTRPVYVGLVDYVFIRGVLEGLGQLAPLLPAGELRERRIGLLHSASYEAKHSSAHCSPLSISAFLDLEAGRISMLSHADWRW